VSGGTPLTPDSAPLTPEEQKAVARLFSDPFYFPLQFKTWIQWMIESAAGGIAGGQGMGSAVGGNSDFPIGSVLFQATAVLPAGFLWTDGGAYSRTGYNPLYKAIGTQFGVGDGSTTFNVPDIQGRMIVGRGPNADVAGLGQVEPGAQAAPYRRPKHRTNAVDPHSHPIPAVNGSGGTRGLIDGSLNFMTASNNTTLNVGTGVSTDPLDTAPYIALNGMIRYI